MIILPSLLAGLLPGQSDSFQINLQKTQRTIVKDVADLESRIRRFQQRLEFSFAALLSTAIDQHDHVDLAHNTLLMARPDTRLGDDNIIDE